MQLVVVKRESRSGFKAGWTNDEIYYKYLFLNDYFLDQIIDCPR